MSMIRKLVLVAIATALFITAPVLLTAAATPAPGGSTIRVARRMELCPTCFIGRLHSSAHHPDPVEVRAA